MQRFIIICSILISTVCFVPDVVNASYSRPYLFSDIQISMTEKALKKYHKLLNDARSNPARMISEKIKSYKLPGMIKWKQQDLTGRIIERKASIEIRLTGDWTDHLGTEKKGDFSSLKIKMLDGNLAGIVKFRLLRYKTRYLDEITASLLMEMLGFPVPYRGAMSVNINGSGQFMIFEEAPVKEFIERYGLRETAIVEGNERQLWQNRSLRNHPNCLGKITVEDECSVDVDPNIIFGKIDNETFLKNKIAFEIGNDAILSHKNLHNEFLNLSEKSPKETK